MTDTPSVHPDRADSPPLPGLARDRAAGLALLALLLLWAVAGYAYTEIKHAEPYPALMMPPFVFNAGLENGRSSRHVVLIEATWADGRVSRCTIGQALPQFREPGRIEFIKQNIRYRRSDGEVVGFDEVSDDLHSELRAGLAQRYGPTPVAVELELVFRSFDVFAESPTPEDRSIERRHLTPH